MITPPHRFAEVACSSTCLLRIFLGTLIWGLSSALSLAQDVDPAEVEKLIRKSVSYLYSRMDGDNWMDNREVNNPFEYTGGLTALCVLALLNAGESPDEPRIQAALRFLETHPDERTASTYAVSLRLMAFAAADPQRKRYAAAMERDVRWLVGSQLRSGNSFNGGWDYHQTPSGSDPSNSQFAVLALNDAVQVGYEVDRDVWVRANEYWDFVRNGDGGFFYRRGDGGPSTGSMTCAGLASCIIVEDNLLNPADFLVDGRVDCSREVIRSERVQGAINWLARRFSVAANPRSNTWKYYYLYGLERAGRLAGVRFFGEHDWYREGAAHLLLQQNPREGSFSEDRSPVGPIRDTAFALLFLSKGLRPILFGKYQYSDDPRDWDRHPDGVHMLSRETEKAWSLPLNWQTIDARQATVNDLRQAPVLFISGRNAIRLSEPQKNTLRSYVENGGMIFAEACQGDGCGDESEFDRTFRELINELFPESTWEVLPKTHPVWSAQFPLIPDPERPILGLQACCRTSVIYCPRNLSCYWQLDRPSFLPQLPETVRRQVTWCRHLGINVAAYATGREVANRLSVPKINDAEVSVLENRVLTLPKLVYRGATDEAPHAWKNAQQEFFNRTGFDIKIEKKSIPLAFSQTQREMANYPLLFLHGRSTVNFTDDERQALKNYVEAGNLLLVDSICGSEEFAQSFRRELERVFPGELTEIPTTHRFISGTFTGSNRQGYDLRNVTLRIPDAAAEQGYRSERGTPKLWGIEREGRLAIIFSPNDLSCALENASANQCRGYSREDAVRIVVNTILYGLFTD